MSKKDNKHWRDKLLHASFRKVPFYVLNASMEGGRRNILHKYPFKDETYVEDIGADADVFSIQGYVIANKDNDYDYFAERDALINALKGEGKGTLVHPFLGVLNVSISGTFRMEESFQNGGIARFTITFVQSGNSKYPGEVTDSVGATDNEADLVDNTVTDSFGNRFITNASGSSLTRSLANITGAYNIMRQGIFAVRGGPNALLKFANNYIDSAVLATTITTMDSACTIASYVLGAMDAFKSLRGAVGNYTNNIITGICSGRITNRDLGFTQDRIDTTTSIKRNYGVSVVKELLDMSEYSGVTETISTTTLSGVTESANKENIKNMTITFALTEACRMAVRIDYNGKDDLDNMMNLICDAINTQLANLGLLASYDYYKTYGIDMDDKETYSALENLRNVFVKSMREIRKTLITTEIVRATADPYPAMILAYSKYKDLDMETDIINRNYPNIKHPGFLPGGIDLEIKSEGS